MAKRGLFSTFMDLPDDDDSYFDDDPVDVIDDNDVTMSGTVHPYKDGSEGSKKKTGSRFFGTKKRKNRSGTLRSHETDDRSWEEKVRDFESIDDEYYDDYDRGGKVMSFTPSNGARYYIASPKDITNLGEIADRLRNHEVIYLNRENTDDEYYYHIVYFIGGVVYGMGGRFVKIGSRFFLATPDQAEIGGELLKELKGGAFPFSD